MISKVQLQKQLNVNASKLQQLINAAGLQPDQVQFSDDQSAAIHAQLKSESGNRPQLNRPNKPGSRSESSLAMPGGSNLPAIGNLAQRNFAGAMQAGKQLAQQETVAMASAYAQEKAALTEQFFGMIEEVNSQVYLDVDATLSALPASSNEGFFTAMLPQGND